MGLTLHVRLSHARVAPLPWRVGSGFAKSHAMSDGLDVWIGDAASFDEWRTAAADGSRADLALAGRALRFSFELAGPTSWVIARRDIAAELPPHYAILLRLRGAAPPNQLQCKLVDPSGQNVWWWRIADFEPTADGRTLILRRAALEFAWGPRSGGMPERIGAIELAWAAGSGGTGTVYIDEVRLEARPAPANEPKIVGIRASSDGGDRAIESLLGDVGHWQPNPSDERPYLELDLGGPGEWGGVIVDFASEPAIACRLSASHDGASWTPLANADGGAGKRRWLRTPAGDGRFARLDFAPGTRPVITRLRMVALEQAVAPARHLAARAAQARRGSFPRHLLGEQTYWALVGGDGERRKGLLSESGAVEIEAEGFTLEPFLWVNDRLITWADVEPELHLADGHLPLPSVRWRIDALQLEIRPFAAGEVERSALIVQYELANRGANPARLRLFVAVRPFQVNPTWQSLNMKGGIAPLTRLENDHRVVRVNRERQVVCVSPPDGCGAAPSEEGLRALYEGALPGLAVVDDPVGFAEAALAYDVELAPGEKVALGVAVPWYDATPPLPTPPDRSTAAHWLEGRRHESLTYWRRRLQHVPIELPACARDFSDSLRASLAWILVNREGPRIQPGPRCYRRSWIRDGTLTGTALAEMGFADEARAFLRWYAPYQRDDGQVPCAVDRHGVDPVDEHDSHGQLIWGVVEVYRLTGDRAFLAELWPRVLRAADAIAALRARRTTAAHRGKPSFGLLPESISHEGYASQPVHSYWDDFFAVRGLADAAFAANVLGDPAAARLTAWRDAMRVDLHASIAQVLAEQHLDFLPGSVELGDFDPTSTAIALDPGGEGARLPATALARTFARYWEEFDQRRRGIMHNESYTAYEVRNAPALVLLGQRQRAVELLQWLMDDQRPPAWRQWPEVSTRDPRVARFLGDLPHGWIASSFARAVRRMLAYERADDGVLVLAAGVPEAWVRQAPGVRVRQLPTHYGRLDLHLQAVGEHRIVVHCGGALSPAMPGIVLHAPCEQPLRRVQVDGRVHPVDAPDRVHLTALPREVVLHYDD